MEYNFKIPKKPFEFLNSYKQEQILWNKNFHWLWEITGLGQFGRIGIFFLQHQHKVVEV